jgi:putative membrane protein
MLPLLLAVTHLLGLVFGVTVLVLRAQALARAERADQLKPVFLWDNLYAGVAFVWIGSGLLRAFGGFEKGADYYLSNHVFWTKLLFLAVVLGAEGVLVVRFIRWRIAVKRGTPIAFEKKPALLRLHWVELWSIAGMVTMAVLMARGVGVVPPKPEGTIQTKASLPEGDRGAEIYRVRCLTCHQVDGRGLGGKLAADFVGDPSRLTKPEALLIASVEHGVPNTAMRAFGGELEQQEIVSVVRYVRQRFGKPGAGAERAEEP